MSCIGFNKLKEWTWHKMREAINENKWYLSEQNRHEVGFTEAELDFLKNHSAECGAKWRVVFCRDICEFSEICELGQKMVERDKKEE